MDHRSRSLDLHKIPRLSLNRRPPVSPIRVTSRSDLTCPKKTKAEVTQILQSLTARLRESITKREASFERYLDQQDIDLPVARFPQFLAIYLSNGELLTRIPGVTIQQDNSTTKCTSILGSKSFQALFWKEWQVVPTMYKFLMECSTMQPGAYSSRSASPICSGVSVPMREVRQFDIALRVVVLHKFPKVPSARFH